jgi:SnoaL-like domain
MSQQRTMARGWTIEGFRSFWAKPDLSLIPRIYEISTNDIVGYWPPPIGVVRDSEADVAVIEAIARVSPDLSLTVPEYARSGELHLVRWVATGTGHDGPFEFNGLDRLRVLRDGRVCENYIFCDHPFWRRLPSTSEGNSELS